jgi:DHA3 family tetracycline resistance protein-like MFS transporter
MSFRVRKLDAYRIYLIMSGATALFFTLVFTVNMVYQAQTIGLTALQLVLVGTTLEIAVFLFEVPTGVVADVYSRRLSIIIGMALIGAGFMLEGSIPHFEAVLLCQVLWGIGYTFTSGATQAWITDEIGEDRAGRAFMRGSQVSHLVGLAGTVVSVGLGSIMLNLPIVLGGALFIALAVFLILFMPETGFKPAPAENRSSWQQMAHTLRGGVRVVRGHPVLLSILGIGLFYGLYSEGLDRLWTKHFLDNFTFPAFGNFEPVVWIGAISMAAGLLSTGATQWMVKRLDMTSATSLAKASFLVSGLLVASLLGFALAGNFLVAVLTIWAINLLRSLLGPLQSTWINQGLDSSVRATVISMSGQVDALGQIAGGPVVGAIGNVSVRAALAASSLILSPVLILYMRVLRRTPAPEMLSGVEA